MKIDAHQHFWNYNQKEYDWIDDSMAILQKDHTPADLQAVLQANDIDGSIAVQARQTLRETQWLLELADQSPIIKGVVGWVDLRSPSVESQLELFSSHAKFVGVRHVVQGEPDDNFILGETFVRGVQLLTRFNLAYDILVFPKQLPASIQFVENLPDHRFVLDHIAKPFIKDTKISPWNEHIQELAQAPNVYCKISGMVTEADWHNWTIADFEPYLDVIIEAFGMNRVMFGSDWPVCTVAAAYEKVIEIVQHYLDKNNISTADQAAFWGKNAAHFYQLQV